MSEVGVSMKKRLIAGSAIAALALSLGSTTGAVADDKFRDGKGISNIFSGLVKNGTLTQAQVDAISKAMQDARGAGKAAYEAAKAERIKVITDALGIDAATLEAKRKAGQSLADIAGDKKDALITALVAYENKKIDAAVADGKLSAERATALKSKLTAGITAMVNNEAKIGKAFKGFGKKGHGRGGK
jgi:polyhydroxyalkanoate synthesis regulator phasin